MIRPGAAGPLSRALSVVKPSARVPMPRSTPRALRPSSLALTTYKPFTTSLQRFQSANTIDTKHEAQVLQKHLKAHPDQVSTTSSVHQVFHEKGVKEEEEKGEDMLAGVKGDLVHSNLITLLLRIDH